MILFEAKNMAIRRRIGFAIIGCVLSLMLSARLAQGVDISNFKFHPEAPSGGQSVEAPPPPRWNGDFPFSVGSLRSGSYSGQYRTNSVGEKTPDGSGTLYFKEGDRRREQFTCWWIMGTPGTVEYRFANGWKWYGDFSDSTAVGPLHTGDTWQTGLTFENAAKQARASAQTAINSPTEDTHYNPPDLGNAEQRIEQVLNEERSFLILAQISADDFVSCIQICSREIQDILQSGTREPAMVQKISEFWKKAAQGVLDGYRTDRNKAMLVHRKDGNRRFLEVALGAAAANYATTGTKLTDWGGDYLFPFPQSDRIEVGELSPSPSPSSNYLWQTFPPAVLEQSAAAGVLPRVIKLSFEESADKSPGANDSQTQLQMALVPNPKGLVRQPGSTNDQAWYPDAPFYMAVTETSFGQMRLYRDWAKLQISNSPKQMKWFVPMPATKQLVGKSNKPYTGATLDEALSFCNWLSFCHGRESAYTRNQDGNWTLDRSKDGFRLPDEYEWEYAARFGFDFLSASGTPSWQGMKEQFRNMREHPDRRLVWFFTATTGLTGTSTRAVDDPGTWLYPLGLRDLCGNASELCMAVTSTADTLRWVVRGGQYDSQFPGGVMPWFGSTFSTENANPQVGFRVVLPVPMDNFLNE
jgi:formylglycine-generating enzyme required for sulfatase activity